MTRLVVGVTSVLTLCYLALRRVCRHLSRHNLANASHAAMCAVRYVPYRAGVPPATAG